VSFKLDLINTCLALTGNNHVDVEGDGSDEWAVAGLGYDAALKYLLGGHDWKFATQIVTLNRVGDSTDDNYTDAYAKPDNSLGLVWVRVAGVLANWRIVGNRILVNASDEVTAKYILLPTPEGMPLLFNAALEALVKAACYEGLNNDASEARNLRGEAEAKLALARTRSDREESPRKMFRSSLLAKRRRGRA
jgi:hypothetical protein